MTVTALDFTLSPELEAHEPPEARGLRRGDVRLLAGTPGSITHHVFRELPQLLRAGDLLVVNNSHTMPAAVDILDSPLTLHLSTWRDDGSWLVELRAGLQQHTGGSPGQVLRLPGGATATLRTAYSSRLWIAALDLPSVPRYLQRYGRPIRYSHVDRTWPISAYQTVFAAATGDDEHGSAEMPSAGRPFTEALVTELIRRGVLIAPITLHTGVASLEAHEQPYPERFAVPPVTARLVNETRRAGHRVIAVGTTVVRALESAAARDGSVAAAAGWTDLVITPERGVHAVDGLLTGFHEPRASHLLMLEALASTRLLSEVYQAAVRGGYLWHEFGDVNLLLPGG